MDSKRLLAIKESFVEDAASLACTRVTSANLQPRVRRPNDELLFSGFTTICIIGELVAEEATVNLAENNSGQYR